MDAAEQWRASLATWAIPAPILVAAPQSPWGFPPTLFAQRADRLVSTPTPSLHHARAALPEQGSVLDVGCGAGAGSVPLVPAARQLIGVDPSPELLGAFRARGEARGAAVTTIAGTWPDVADRTPPADVVVCHHVFYNVPDLAPFAQRLTDHARRRVVVEVPVYHPMHPLNDLWRHFQGVVRPQGPTVEDAVAVLHAIGVHPAQERWEAPAMGWAGAFARREDLVAWVRHLLCLPATRDDELDAYLMPRLITGAEGWSLPPQPVVTLWWAGTAA